MTRYELVIDDVPVTVEILSLSAGQATVSVNGVTVEVELPPGTVVAPARPSRHAPVLRGVRYGPRETQGWGTATAARRPSLFAGEAIYAPLPGSVVAVLVQVGDHVDPGTPVVLMEAMKMENEIQAHTAGRVTAVWVKAGQAVKVNDVLVVVAPGG
ncbi:MAG: biotin/lipoyl-containing protein [Thermodesulfobacteriota bacterium]|jgi:biotin carboxyl carrier protein